MKAQHDGSSHSGRLRPQSDRPITGDAARYAASPRSMDAQLNDTGKSGHSSSVLQPVNIFKPEGDYRGFIEVVLMAKHNKRQCASDLISIHTETHSRLLQRHCIRTLRPTRDRLQDLAEELGVTYKSFQTTTRDGKLSERNIIRIMRADRAFARRVIRFLTRTLPAVQALIPVEDRVRRYWLPLLMPGVPQAPVSEVTLAEAAVMCAWLYEFDEFQKLLDWYRDDLVTLGTTTAFIQFLRTILDEAVEIASGHSSLLDELTAWPCPLKECGPFKDYFINIWNARHLSWFVAYEANRWQFSG